MGLFKTNSPLVKALTSNANFSNVLKPLIGSGCTHSHGRSLVQHHPSQTSIMSHSTQPKDGFSSDLETHLSSKRDTQADLRDYNQILANNKMWVKKRNEIDPDHFKKANHTQNPKYLWIGCSDARVPAENLTGLNDGEIFVHRNIANLVVNTDLNMLSVLTYAVDVLKVKHIIVCGHYGCGGVKAAVETNQDLGVIEHWLRNVRDVKRLHMTELDSIVDDQVRYRRLVELNVVEQCINLFKTGVVQNARTDTGYPLIHGLVYDIDDGLLKEINLDLIGYMKQYRSVYRLYS
eukprot:CFRG0043T1